MIEDIMNSRPDMPCAYIPRLAFKAIMSDPELITILPEPILIQIIVDEELQRIPYAQHLQRVKGYIADFYRRVDQFDFDLDVETPYPQNVSDWQACIDAFRNRINDFETLLKTDGAFVTRCEDVVDSYKKQMHWYHKFYGILGCKISNSVKVQQHVNQILNRSDTLMQSKSLKRGLKQAIQSLLVSIYGKDNWAQVRLNSDLRTRLTNLFRDINKCSCFDDLKTILQLFSTQHVMFAPYFDCMFARGYIYMLAVMRIRRETTSWRV
jgi:hypothetical protein